jgi:hypothetical protein
MPSGYDHHNAVADDEAQVFLVCFLHVVCIHNLYLASDAGVFVDNGLAERCVRPHAQGNGALLEVGQPLRRGFVIVGAHQQRMINHTASFDARADADDRALHRTFLQNTSLAEQGDDQITPVPPAALWPPEGPGCQSPR